MAWDSGDDGFSDGFEDPPDASRRVDEPRPPTPAASPVANQPSGFWRFWSTLPGVLTALAGLVGAIAALVALFVSRSDNDPNPASPPVVTVGPAPSSPPTDVQPPETVPPVPSAISANEVNLPPIQDADIDAAVMRIFEGCAAGDPVSCVQLFDGLANECHAGYGVSCDQLAFWSPAGSTYEAFGASCGGRIPDYSYAGYCAIWVG